MADIYEVNTPNRKPLFEGVQGENEARSIVFDISSWVEELGDGAVTATAKRSKDSQPYPVTVTKDGNTVTWKPTSTDTAFAGFGSFQLEYTVGGVLAKTCIWTTAVAPSLDPAGDPPDPYDNWLADMRQVAAEALQHAQDAEQSAQDAADEVDNAKAEVYEAEAWAKGTKNGTPVSSTDAQYQNNAKYFAEESYKNAEAWAVGQRGGVDVPSTDETYHNNAKYYAEEAEQAKTDIESELDDYARIDGYYEDLTAGNAEQLLSTVQVEDQAPYLFRTSGGSTDIGNREIDKIVGGSVAWNQLVNVNTASTPAGLTLTFNPTTGEITLSGSATSTYGYIAYNAPVTKDHKYLVGTTVTANPNSLMFQCGMNNAGVYSNLGTFVIRNVTSSIISGVAITGLTVGTDYTGIKFKFQIHDLTAMFGASIADHLYAMEQANAGSAITLFRSWFPKDYYAYNTGTLMSVKTSAHEMVGFNQWDEQWELGQFNNATGEPISANDSIRCKNFIPVLPSTSYYGNQPTSSFQVFYYDDSKAFISQTWVPSGNTFTTPSNCHYMKFRLANVYGTTYNNDICINLSWSGWRNGEYEPYVKHTYPLDDIELRGVPKLVDGEIQYDGDTYEADGTVTRRYGIVDLGTLTWTYNANYTVPFFYANMPSDSIPMSAAGGYGVASKYVCYRKATGNDPWFYVGMPDKNFTYSASGLSASVKQVYIRDDSYTDATAFKTAMNGVFLVYELATPTTETADPYTNPQIVDDFGTERYVDEREVAVPVGHMTEYPANLRDKLQHLPDLAGADGAYLIRQTGHQMSLDLFRIPKAPTTDGTYVLKATVSGGTPTYTWEVEE